MMARALIALLCAGGVLAGCAAKAPGEGAGIDSAKILAALRAGAVVSEAAFLRSAAEYTKQCSAEKPPASCGDWFKACRAFKTTNAVVKPNPEVQAVVCEAPAK